MRAHARAAEFIEEKANRDEVCALLSAPNRVGGTAEVIRRTLDGDLKVAPDGTTRRDQHYLRIGRAGAGRPNPDQAAWLYAQMVRWGQAPFSAGMLEAAKRVFRSDLYEEIVGSSAGSAREPADGIGAFAGPQFDPTDVESYLAAWKIQRPA